MSQFQKNLALWLVILLFMIALFNIFSKQPVVKSEVIYSEFTDAVDRGDVNEVKIQGHAIAGKFKNGKPFETFAPDDAALLDMMRSKKVKITVLPPEQASWWMSIFISWFPMLLLIVIWVFFMRQMQGGGAKAMSFGKSRAKLMVESKNKITFKDVAGVEEAKEELAEIIEFLKNPGKFQKLGGKLPKGVLLIGSPGTGKTLLARAIAGEADVPFFSISGSDFVEMFVGVGASRVRDLFEQGKKNAPCIIFVDEIDAVGRHRGAGLGGGHDEREQTLNQLLVEMDGFESAEGVIMIAATNRPDVLDPALLRPGRFDRQVVVPQPDMRGREEILKVHAVKLPLSEGVDMQVVARGTPGFSGADLANLVNEAALLAARREKDKVEMGDLEDAKDKVMMGVERRSTVISEKEKKNTAYHEAGHALVATMLPGTDPIHKITIIPRGMALGLTQQLPEDEKHTFPRTFLLNSIATLMGGRAAEELAMHEMTTGAGNDIERATDLARRMVCKWGMSDKMGPLAFGKREEHMFLGREISQPKDYSEDTAREIDREVERIVKEAMDKAKSILTEHRDKLDKLAQALLDKETLGFDELRAIVEGRELPSGNGHKASAAAEVVPPSAPESAPPAA
ncbi:MAG: ATP-dependent metallopeptidase FtsH/Yme1/Tma family protein [Nitrospinae bacterium]|nr:ATP-dependent metallopeptidase FtsH/Yme1/Tma family protein [Nitrospinota bacterium]